MPTASGHTAAISARKVIDTDVFDTSGNKIGEVKDVVLDKSSNNIMFAVVGFGGFLGMGERFHPVPWGELDYSEDRNGYVVSFTKEQLKSAPTGSKHASRCSPRRSMTAKLVRSTREKS